MSGNRTLYVEVILTIHPDAAPELQTDDAIRAEFTSWLEDLGAQVQQVVVRDAPEEV